MRLRRTESGSNNKLPVAPKPEKAPGDSRLKGWFVSAIDSFSKKHLPRKEPHLDNTDNDIQLSEFTPHSAVNTTLPSSKTKQPTDRLQKLATKQTITARHSTLGEAYKFAHKKMSAVPEPSDVNPEVSKQFDKDKVRSSNLYLEVNLPNQTMGVQGEVLPILVETASQLSPKDGNKLLLRLTELCSQTTFNPLSDTIVTHGFNALDDAHLSLLSKVMHRVCKLTYSAKKNEIHADLTLTTDQVKFLDLGASEPVQRQCNIKVNIGVSFPVNDPDDCNIGPIKMEINVPPRATTTDLIRAGMDG